MPPRKKTAETKPAPESRDAFVARVIQEIREIVDRRTLERTDDELEGAKLASDIVGSLADAYEMLANDLDDEEDAD